MDDAGFVRRIECGQHLNTNVEDLRELESLAMNEVSQRLAVDEFSGEKRQSIDFTKLKNRQNIRLVQRRRDFCFLSEALHASLVLRDVRRKHFQRNCAIESRVAREINFAHAARAERAENDVRTKLLSLCESRSP